MTPQFLTPHQSQYIAWLLTRRAAGESVESLASTLVDSQVDLNPHQVDAALFACQNPLSRGVILADEVGLGKTIEAGLVISQRWAERRRRILIIVPANLRKQWHQELQDKFNLQGLILESKSYNAIRKQERQNPFRFSTGPVICSYQFAKAKAGDIKEIEWDLVVLDEAHRTAATSSTLEEKLSWKKKQRELEGNLCRELFDRQDEVEAQRNNLIGQLEMQLQQHVEERTLFTIDWELN